MIQVNNLTKKFRGNTAVDSLDFEIAGGEVFGCLGHNGAGKTTTIRLLLGLLKPTSGQALVWGKPLSDHPRLRRNVGVLLENDGLYENLSAEQNLEYYARLYEVEARDEKIRQALEVAGLAKRRHEKIGTYSRGMRRKLGLVRAIMHQPSVLLLDEPSAGLDPEVQKMVRDLIITLAREEDKLIFLCSHDLDEVERICNRIAILQRGRVITCDSLENLRNSYREPAAKITFSSQEQAADAEMLVKNLNYVSHTKPGTGSLTVFLNDDRISDLLFKLVSGGIRIEEVKRLNRSLEDIYLEVIHREEKRE